MTGPSTTTEGREVKATWPYTSFRTLLNLFDRIHTAKAVPPQIDRSFLGGSEGQKTQVLAALRFFGLIDENGNVGPLMSRLALKPDDRPTVIRSLLEKHYPDATALAAKNGTTTQLEETFVGVGGDTRRKAIAFYIHAAKFSSHPLSKFFKTPTGFYKPRKTRSPSGGSGNGGATTQEQPATATMVTTDPKARYLEMLMEKAKTADAAEADKLFNRIEKMLGVPDAETDTEAK